LLAGTGLATTGIYKFFNQPPSPEVETAKIEIVKGSENVLAGADKPNTYKEITNYNNYYEFSTDKSSVADEAKDFVTRPWTLEVGGLVNKPKTFDIDDLLKFQQEERIYRFRCVEGWSMVIPWVGFPLKTLLDQVEPLGTAKYVAFETYFDKKQMPKWRYAGIDLPYVEGLRLDEAQHKLTILATGLYGKQMPNQNGAPIRLVVPWKYGFKSVKSIVKITLTDTEPATTWNLANPSEYGFYSNVNPGVSHPRWSQASERRIGDFGTRKTMMFNGYADDVANLYEGMDLKKYF
jgi:methionine sulfoxide reductase catalytic subunit